MIRRLVLLVALTPLVALAQSATTYVVQPGDTLYRISRAHDLTVDGHRCPLHPLHQRSHGADHTGAPAAGRRLKQDTR